MVDIMEKIVILVDTREKRFNHVEKHFQRFGINYKFKKLNFGDYSIEVDGMSLEELIYIERKSGLDELCQNFGKYRERFINEFERAKEVKAKGYLMIEDASYEDVIYQKYRSAMNPKALLRSIMSFEARYNLSTAYITKKASGNFIYFTLISYAMEYLKIGGETNEHRATREGIG